jgi:hypothetical protein
MAKLTLTLSLLLWSKLLMAQNAIPIFNFSFEDGLAEAGTRFTEIPGWIDCGDNTETAPDVHSELSDFHGVKHSAAHGFNFLMMVTRDNDTQEMLCAPLPNEMEKDSNYILSVELAKPATCISRSKKLEIEMEYNQGVILRIFGGNKACEVYQLLAESPVINDVDWNEHQFLLMPQRNYDYLFLQAYYDGEAQEPYNGSILLDNVQLFSKSHQHHQAMHTMIASGKQYEWHSVLKIDEAIAELVPEGLESFPENSDQITAFQDHFAPLIYQYELLNMERFFTNRAPLLDFIKQTDPERLILTIEALRYIHAHRTAEVIEKMFHYFQLQQTGAIKKLDAAYQMKKLEIEFDRVMETDEVIVKRVRHVMTFRTKYLTDIKMAMVELLVGRELLNMAKKNP